MKITGCPCRSVLPGSWANLEQSSLAGSASRAASTAWKLPLLAAMALGKVPARGRCWRAPSLVLIHLESRNSGHIAYGLGSSPRLKAVPSSSTTDQRGEHAEQTSTETSRALQLFNKLK
eukprot:scpid32570/ scgid32147/ 